jgi:hypothetical protein
VDTRRRSGPVDIAEVLRDARLGDLRGLHEQPADYDALHSATLRLFALLAEKSVPYVLVGGMAMLQYVEGRNTRDIDLIVATGDLKRVPEISIESSDRDFARGSVDGVQIDLLLTSNALFKEVKERFVNTRGFAEREIPTATPEGLVLLKLFALPSLYRQGETVRAAIYETDVRVLLDQYPMDVEPILRELSAHVLATDLTAIREILGDIQSRIARFERTNGSPAED